VASACTGTTNNAKKSKNKIFLIVFTPRM